MIGPPIVLIFTPVIIYLMLGTPLAGHRELGRPPAQEISQQEIESGDLGPVDASRAKANTRTFGMALFRRYLFPFEIVSIVLLVAMLGAIVLGRKRFTSYTEEEEARMLATAHYHGTRIAQPSGESAEKILKELQEEDETLHKHPGRDFRVFPEYEE